MKINKLKMIIKSLAGVEIGREFNLNQLAKG